MKKILIYLIIVLGISYCSQPQNIDIVAQVNDEILTRDEFKAHYSNEKWKTLSKKEKKEFIQKWIQLTILAQEFDLNRISDNPKLKLRLEIAEKNIKANALLAQNLSKINISENDLFNYYKVHKSEYEKEIEEFKVQRIICNNEERLEAIRDKIANSSFTKAAMEFSEEPAGKNGGYIGWKSEETTQQKIWNGLKSLKKYHYKTIQLNNKFYIIRYYDTRTKKLEKNFTEVVDEIRTKVIQNNKKEIFNELIEKLKRKSKVIIAI